MQSQAKKSLRCISFHSVKGGVGKSTLSYLVARAFARNELVALIDTDLTGTSLADVLPLRPPQWANHSPSDKLPLNIQPDGWGSKEDGFGGLKNRAAEEQSHARHVPLLNDFLLWAEHRHDIDKDVHPEALFWRLPEGDACEKNLCVVPSSALPNDLTHILHVIYDELHAGFLESRLEWLLHFILQKTNIRTVVFDTPPTIPGLSRAVLSMAMRLPLYHPLTTDGAGSLLELTKEHTFPIDWSPCLITTPDLQDMRAAERWLENLNEDELERIKIVLNSADRDWPSMGQSLQEQLAGSHQIEAKDYSGPLFRRDPVCILATGELRIFRAKAQTQDSPAALQELLSILGAPL